MGAFGRAGVADRSSNRHVRVKPGRTIQFDLTATEHSIAGS